MYTRAKRIVTRTKCMKKVIKNKEKNNLNFGTLCSWENIKCLKILVDMMLAENSKCLNIQAILTNTCENRSKYDTESIHQLRSHGRESA